jgi:hypothetical protein
MLEGRLHRLLEDVAGHELYFHLCHSLHLLKQLHPYNAKPRLKHVVVRVALFAWTLSRMHPFAKHNAVIYFAQIVFSNGFYEIPHAPSVIFHS